jgi:hypothetical protein
MTSDERVGPRILGTLRSADGKGVVRMQDRYDTDIDDLWSALTDPRRLARWLGEVEGDARLGGEFRFHFLPADRKAPGASKRASPRDCCCSPWPWASRTRMSSRSRWPPTATRPAWFGKNGACPWTCSPPSGWGCRIHVEDLAAHVAGREPCDAGARWDELQPAYEALAAKVG